MRRSLKLLLAVFAAAAIGCADNGPGGSFEPEPPTNEPQPPPSQPQLPPDLTRLEVRPANFALATSAPGNTLQLTAWAFYRNGAICDCTGTAAYSSSAPAIAAVSSGGLITAAAPGTAEIMATLTQDGITRSASMTVTVYDRDLQGDYNLNALITSFDPAWGEDLEGYRYLAAVTLEEQSGPAWVTGWYADLRLVSPGGDSYPITDFGLVTGDIGPNGEALIELLGEGDSIDLTLIVGAATPTSTSGTWGCCGHISGTFTIERR
jgi:Bacterial Ig-like domain (group 2)